MPGTIAVIGASNDPSKYGHRALKAWRETDWTVYAVNPRVAEVDGMTAYDSVLDIPGPVDAATLYIPPLIGLEIAHELIAKGVGIVYLNPGSANRTLRETLEQTEIEVIESCSIIASRAWRQAPPAL